MCRVVDAGRRLAHFPVRRFEHQRRCDQRLVFARLGFRKFRCHWCWRDRFWRSKSGCHRFWCPWFWRSGVRYADLQVG
jgi:hypothetical protein